MKKKTLGTFLIVIISVAAAAVATAQQEGGHHPQGSAAGEQQGAGTSWMPPWVQNMPAERQAVFQKIFETRTQTITPLVMQLRAKQAQLMADLAQENVKRQTVDKTLKEINDLEAQIRRAQVDLALEVKQQFPQAFMQHMLMKPGMGMGMGFGLMDGQCMGMRGGQGGMMGGGMMGGGMMGGHGRGMGGQGGGMMGGPGTQ